MIYTKNFLTIRLENLEIIKFKLKRTTVFLPKIQPNLKSKRNPYKNNLYSFQKYGYIKDILVPYI